MTDDERKGGRRAARARSRAWPAALAALIATTAIACDGSLGQEQQTPDPNVRGDFSGYFMWAVGEPTIALGPVQPAAAEGVITGAAESIEPDRDARFGISIVATFEAAEAAEAQAAAVREILRASAAWYANPANDAALAQLEDDERPAPFTPPEVAALKERLLAPGERGVGWGGQAGKAEDAVYTVGPMLVVTGLKSEAAAEAPADGAIGADLPMHPLAHLLAAAGGAVLLEGDRYGEGSIVADLSCQPADSASGTALLDELGDSILTAGQYWARPPWIGQPLTAREALARATIRRWQQGMSAAMGDADGRLEDYAVRILNGTAEERATAQQEFEAYLRERGAELIEGEVDVEVLALLLDPKAQTDAASRQAWAGALGERIGRLPMETSPHGDLPAPDDYARLLTTGTLRIQDGRLEMGWLTFGRLAAGLPSLVGHLTGTGCADIRMGLVDFDAVRGN